MRVRNISKIVLYHVKIHRKHIGKTIVVHNLELAITPNMGHDGWASVVKLSNIHGRSIFTSRFHLYKNTKVSMETP